MTDSPPSNASLSGSSVSSNEEITIDDVRNVIDSLDLIPPESRAQMLKPLNTKYSPRKALESTANPVALSAGGFVLVIEKITSYTSPALVPWNIWIVLSLYIVYYIATLLVPYIVGFIFEFRSITDADSEDKKALRKRTLEYRRIQLWKKYHNRFTRFIGVCVTIAASIQ